MSILAVVLQYRINSLYSIGMKPSPMIFPNWKDDLNYNHNSQRQRRYMFFTISINDGYSCFKIVYKTF